MKGCSSEDYEVLRGRVKNGVYDVLLDEGVIDSRNETSFSKPASLPALGVIMGLEDMFGVEIDDEDADSLIESELVEVSSIVDYLVCREGVE